MRPWLRSVLGILTGIVVIVGVSSAYHRLALRLTGYAEDRPSPLYHLAELGIVGLAAILAGYFVARIDSDAPLAHGATLAVLLLVWYGVNLPKAYGGRGFSYLVGLTLGMPLLVLLGTALETRRLRSAAPALRPPRGAI